LCVRGRWLLVTLVTIATFTFAFLLSDAPAAFLILEDRFDTVDAALVMAGDPDYERTITAARLVAEGKARLFVATGGGPGPGENAVSLREKAIALGVPPERIRMEQVSRGTLESLLAVRPILLAEGATSIVLVTSPYHQRRAFQLAVRVLGPGVKVLNCPAQPSWWSPHRWWRVQRSRWVVITEYLKLVYYTFFRKDWIRIEHHNGRSSSFGSVGATSGGERGSGLLDDPGGRPAREAAGGQILCPPRGPGIRHAGARATRLPSPLPKMRKTQPR
jgi:uncharacterized SAM-binding protein YcdF (DUF218 family)